MIQTTQPLLWAPLSSGLNPEQKSRSCDSRAHLFQLTCISQAPCSELPARGPRLIHSSISSMCGGYLPDTTSMESSCQLTSPTPTHNPIPLGLSPGIATAQSQRGREAVPCTRAARRRCIEKELDAIERHKTVMSY